MRVKNDFIDVLRNFLKKEREKIQKIENRNAFSTEETTDNIFKVLPNSCESLEERDDDFEKIKEFGKNEDKKNIKNENDISEDTYIEKIDNSFQNNSLDKKNNIFNNTKCRIIYISDLVSIKYIKDEDNKILKKLEEFDYNPKYYNKFKNSLEHDFKNKSLVEAYDNYIKEIYAKIKDKILEFYESFSKTFNIELKKRDIGLMLIQLKKIVEEKIELNLESLIHYLNKFPIKYLKIIPTINTKNNTILRVDERILNSKFRIEYIFPFF